MCRSWPKVGAVIMGFDIEPSFVFDTYKHFMLLRISNNLFILLIIVKYGLKFSDQIKFDIIHSHSERKPHSKNEWNRPSLLWNIHKMRWQTDWQTEITIAIYAPLMGDAYNNFDKIGSFFTPLLLFQAEYYKWEGCGRKKYRNHVLLPVSNYSLAYM